MVHLATWHRARGRPRPAQLPAASRSGASARSTRRIRKIFDSDAHAPIDTLAGLELELLEAKLPAYDGDPVLVQGDTGPGNFMYQDGRIAAIIDWDLGDPMDDLAWLSWRASATTPSPTFRPVREYERHSGIASTDDHVAYRVNAVARLGARFRPRPRVRAGRSPDQAGKCPAPRSRRLHHEHAAPADGAHGGGRLAGMPIRPRQIEDQAEASPQNAMYERAPRQPLRRHPAIEDRGASTVVKGVARHLKEIDRNGRRFDAQELDDITAALGSTFDDLALARPALAEAARNGNVPLEDYLRYQFRRMTRDDWLMRTASGAMFDAPGHTLR